MTYIPKGLAYRSDPVLLRSTASTRAPIECRMEHLGFRGIRTNADHVFRGGTWIHTVKYQTDALLTCRMISNLTPHSIGGFRCVRSGYGLGVKILPAPAKKPLYNTYFRGGSHYTIQHLNDSRTDDVNYICHQYGFRCVQTELVVPDAVQYSGYTGLKLFGRSYLSSKADSVIWSHGVLSRSHNRGFRCARTGTNLTPMSEYFKQYYAQMGQMWAEIQRRTPAPEFK